jgi:hypothetical protein
VTPWLLIFLTMLPDMSRRLKPITMLCCTFQRTVQRRAGAAAGHRYSGAIVGRHQVRWFRREVGHDPWLTRTATSAHDSLVVS